MELEQLKADVFTDNKDKAIDYLDHLIQEIAFYDEIRKMTELKKMHREEGNFSDADVLEKEMLMKVRAHQAQSKLLKLDFLT